MVRHDGVRAMLRAGFALLVFVMVLVFVMMGRWAVPTTRAYVPPGYTPVGPGDVYLALGDSLTTGTEHDQNDDGQPGYPALVYSSLQAEYPDLTFHNLGRDGESSGSMVADGQLAAAESYITITSEITTGRTVGLITLSIGGNDMVSILPAPGGESADGAQTLASFTANLDTILSRLVAAITDANGQRQADIIIMDYYNPYPDLSVPPTGEKMTDTWTPQFNAAIHQAAETYGIPVAEVYDAFRGRSVGDLTFVNPEIYTNPMLLGDETSLDYHPTQQGHQTIADEFLAVSSYTQQTDELDEQVFIPLVIQ